MRVNTNVYDQNTFQSTFPILTFYKFYEYASFTCDLVYTYVIFYRIPNIAMELLPPCEK